jgi:hypothetical protein
MRLGRNEESEVIWINFTAWYMNNTTVDSEFGKRCTNPDQFGLVLLHQLNVESCVRLLGYTAFCVEETAYIRNLLFCRWEANWIEHGR